MEPTQELLDDIYRERVLRARRTPPAEKILSGIQLFEEACQRMMWGIRHQYPEADEAQVREILTQRLELLRRLREPR